MVDGETSLESFTGTTGNGILGTETCGSVGRATTGSAVLTGLPPPGTVGNCLPGDSS